MSSQVQQVSSGVKRIRRALPYVPKENVILAPDCGMKYLPRKVAFGKLCAMVRGCQQVRAELGIR